MTQITGSLRLKCILHVCLAAGNILNAGSKTVPIAEGFKISSFSKLLQTRSKEGDSFLDYVIQKLLEASPDMLDVRQDTDDLDACKQLSIQALSIDIRSIETSLNVLKKFKESPEFSSSSSTSEDLTNRISTLQSDVQKSLAKVKTAFDNTVEEFHILCDYLGEPRDVNNIESIIWQINNVVLTIDGCFQKAVVKTKSKNHRRSAIVKA